MEELISLSIQLHLLFIVVLIALISINFYLLKSDKTFVNLSKKLELIAPQYYIVLSAIFLTGIIVMGVTKFKFSLAVWIMIGVWIFIVAFGIRGHKIYKKVEKKDPNSQLAYKKSAIKKYAIDLMLILATTAFAYMVH